MKSKFTLLLALFIIAALMGMVTISIQQVSAPRDCGGCAAFKKLTHEFEKNVIEVATSGDPTTIPALLEQYSEDVRALDLAPRG